MTDRPEEFTTEEITELLDELGTRLRQRGLSASIFVVGDAAIAVNHYYTDPTTLEFILDGNDVNREIRLLARDASRRLQRVAPDVARGRNHGVTDPERHFPLPGFDDRSPGRGPEL